MSHFYKTTFYNSLCCEVAKKVHGMHFTLQYHCHRVRWLCLTEYISLLKFYWMKFICLYFGFQLNILFITKHIYSLNIMMILDDEFDMPFDWQFLSIQRFHDIYRGICLSVFTYYWFKWRFFSLSHDILFAGRTYMTDSKLATILFGE